MKRHDRSLMTSVSIAGACALLLFLAGCGGGGGGGASGTSPTPPPAGYVPQNVSAAARAGSITVSWTPVTGATAYNVYWSTSPNVTKQTGTPAGSVMSPYVQTGLPGGTTRYYVATCVVGGSEGPDSPVVSATVPVSLAAGPDVGQYFDRGGYATGLPNYPDSSSHPLRGLTTPDNTLLFGGENCLDCHYVSGPARTSDECLKCHFENQPNAPAGNHRNGIIELATITGNGLPTADNLVNTLQGYDNWCLQCHGSESGITLGGISPLISRRAVLDPAAVENGRHRALNAVRGGPVGCIFCHHPHGRANARIVRENPANRASAGAAPKRFGVYPNDTVGSYTGKYRATANENFPYRARVDNTLPNVFADADDDQNFCTLACHAQKIDPTFAKEKMIRRDPATGNYQLAPGNEKSYLVGSSDYTDNNLLSTFHGHVNGEIIDTDEMVDWYAAMIYLSGPSRYKYPGSTSSNPANFINSTSPLPFFPDFPDGVRDFTNGYINRGPIRYRFTCSTCHDPHGTAEPNASRGSLAYPDLRLHNTNTGLCSVSMCHR